MRDVEQFTRRQLRPNERLAGMDDTEAERAALAAQPLRAARPKGAPVPPTPDNALLRSQLEASVEAVDAEQQAAPAEPTQFQEDVAAGRRRPGRPPNHDPISAIHVIAAVLKPLPRDVRRKILETALDLTT